jgi:hypothetical protein
MDIKSGQIKFRNCSTQRDERGFFSGAENYVMYELEDADLRQLKKRIVLRGSSAP